MKSDKHIEQELREIAPTLASLKKPQNEAVPANYFSFAKENILSKIRKDDVLLELQNIAPTISKIPKPQLEKLPVNYFENLPEKVFQAIQQKEVLTKNAEKEGFFAKISVWIEYFLVAPKLQMAFATLIAAVILTSVYSSLYTEVRNTHLLAEAKAQLTRDDIQFYVIENSDEFDELTLEETLDVEDFDV